MHTLIDNSWRPLPLALDEGLAAWIAGLWSDERRARERLQAACIVGDLLGGMTLTYRLGDAARPVLRAREQPSTRFPPSPVDLVTLLQPNLRAHDLLTEQERLAGRNIGYVVVARLEAQGRVSLLRELCLRAAEQGSQSIDIDEVLRVAGLEDSVAFWTEAMRDLLGPDELALIATDEATGLADRLAQLVWDREPSLRGRSADEVLAACPLVMESTYGEAELDLGGVPAFREAFVAGWGEP